MTGEEKTALASFLNLASDYLNDGHTRDREGQVFSDDAPPLIDAANPPPALPLAYMTEEPMESMEPSDSLESVESGKPAESAEVADSAEIEDSLGAVAAEISNCRSCGLCATRKNTVPGEGVSRPLVMVIGEGPGANEDATGRPFVGRAGQLLDKMLASIALSRDKNCFIANMIKCRPPENRDPAPQEMAACLPFLERQILLLRPQVILCAGRIAAQNLLKTGKGHSPWRGEFAELRVKDAVFPVLSTYHPSFLLREESFKRQAWEDLKLLKSRLTIPDKE